MGETRNPEGIREDIEWRNEANATYTGFSVLHLVVIEMRVLLGPLICRTRYSR